MSASTGKAGTGTTSWSVRLTVAGQKIPVLAFDVTGGCYGSVGHATITTSAKALSGLGIDLFALTASAGGVVPVYLYAWTGTAADPTNQPIFGGEYVSTHFDIDQDTVEINARDWAGLLVDQKRVLTTVGAGVEAVLTPLAIGKNPTAAGVSNENQQLSQIATSIAREFGMTPVINLPGGANPKIGALYGASDQTFMPAPQSLWAIVNQLARDTGNVVFVTPTKQLYFGVPGGMGPQLTFSYDINPLAAGNIDCKNAHVAHHPRRNSTFRVLVISYDPARRQATLGQATAIGRNFAGQGGMAPGVYSGSQAAAANTSLASEKKGVSVTQIPLYTFHVDGLTADQTTTKAASIATDIAKREITLRHQCDIIPAGLVPSQKLQIVGGVKVPSFTSNVTFFVSGYTHRFRMPKVEHGSGDAGLITQVQSLNIPAEGIATAEDG